MLRNDLYQHRLGAPEMGGWMGGIFLGSPSRPHDGGGVFGVPKYMKNAEAKLQGDGEGKTPVFFWSSKSLDLMS